MLLPHAPPICSTHTIHLPHSHAHTHALTTCTHHNLHSKPALTTCTHNLHSHSYTHPHASHTLTLPPTPTTHTPSHIPSHTHHSHTSHTQIHCTQVAVTGLLNLAYSPETHQCLAKPYIIEGVIEACGIQRTTYQLSAYERMLECLLFKYVSLVPNDLLIHC